MFNSSEIEKTLLQLMHQDNEKAVEIMFTTYYPTLCKRVNRIINNSVAAEDIVQDVFYHFWEKRGKLKIELSIGAYLNRMALNAAFT